MSKFHHNSRGAEQLALAWHWFGVVVSLAGFIFSLASVGIVLAMQVLLSVIPGLFGYYFSCACLSAFIFACGVFFHIWACNQHQKHLSSLGKESA